VTRPELHTHIKRESWGYSVFSSEVREGKKTYVQVGAGVGLDPFAFRRLTPSKAELRSWRKRGVCRVKGGQHVA